MGQQQRLALGVFFQSPSDFLIFDESLVFVDQGFARKCQMHFQDLFSSGKTIIVTSHDTSVIRKYCKNAIWLDDSRICMQGEVNEVADAYEKSCE